MTKKKKNDKDKKKKQKLPEFNKYYYYENSVQSPESDVEFFENTYKKLRGKAATTLREDFCGTHMICCEWLKLAEDKKAIGVELDPEPIEYGRQVHEAKLNDDQLKRLSVLQENVLSKGLPKADIVSASNFSYFLFKKREDLKAYFANAKRGVNKDGIFIIDCFGGQQCMTPNEEETEHKGYSYFWDQDSFNPVTNEAMFYIHFKRKGEKKRKKCFVYDWRMWGLAELQDLLYEVGFNKVTVYWEGSDKDGEGNGIFKPTTKGDDAEAWVAYIVSEL